MNGPRDYYTKWSQTEKDEYHIISVVCGILSELTKQKYTHRHRKQTHGYEKGRMGRDKLGVWN